MTILDVHPPLSKILCAVCDEFGVTLEEMRDHSKVRHICDARDAFTLLAWMLTRETMASMTRALDGDGAALSSKRCDRAIRKYVERPEYADSVERVHRLLRSRAAWGVEA
jgi:hypothetical protein